MGQIAEADCLESLKLLLGKCPWAWPVLGEHVANVELLLVSLTSPQLDSKCYALEVPPALSRKYPLEQTELVGPYMKL